MQSFPKTIVLRHRKENLKKCSLSGLEERDDFVFYTYPRDKVQGINGYILLDMNAEPLSEADANCGLFILDGTWRYAEKMYENTPGLNKLIRRSIPQHFITAYPRKQEDCPEPSRGLASVEAIYIAYHLMERDKTGLLDHYHWKDRFLEMNDWN
ncbi:MAG: DTW domain-containing protein [Chlamydiota bacterium]